MMWSKKLNYLVVAFVAMVSSSKATNVETNFTNVLQTPTVQNVRFPGFSFTDPVTFCQSNANPTHTLTFSVTSYTNLGGSNAFELLLSDDNFSTSVTINNPTTTFINATGTTGNYSMTFSFPSGAYGDNYRLRVRSTAPSSFATSQVISVYDIIFNAAIPLNVSNDGNVIICSGSSFTISIIDPGTPNSTPLDYPNLTYVWRKKNGASFVVIPGEIGPSLTVNTAGVYYVEVNYGPICSSSASTNTNAKSVQVTVSEVAGGDTLQINTLGGETEVCESIGVELLLQDSAGNLVASGSNISWFLGGVLIPNANSNTYLATQGGTYTASLNNGSCTISVPNTDAYILDDITYNATLNVSTPYELQIGENFDAIVSTDAIVPSFEWTSNGTVLSTSNTLNISSSGQYTVVVTETSGCVSTIELNLVVIDPSVDEIPNLISPNGDGSNDKFKVPYNLTSANNLSLQIYNSSGKLVYESDNYQNTWPENEEDAFQSKAFFYFKLSKESQIVKEGILTVIK